MTVLCQYATGCKIAPPKEPRYFPENSRFVNSITKLRWRQRDKNNLVYSNQTPSGALKTDIIVFVGMIHILFRGFALQTFSLNIGNN